VRLAPPGDHGLGVRERHEDGRAQRDPAPGRDPLVEFPGGVADLLFGGHAGGVFGQPLDLPAQLQRGGQELVGRPALPAHVLAQPGLTVVGFPAPGQRLSGARQVVEGPSLLRLADLLVDP
jgi:hypothetical protein